MRSTVQLNLTVGVFPFEEPFRWKKINKKFLSLSPFKI